MGEEFGKLQTWRAIYTDVSGACFSSAALSGTGTLRNGIYNILIRKIANDSAAGGTEYRYEMTISGGKGDQRELYVVPGATYTDTIVSGLEIVLAGTLVNGDQARIEVTNQAEMAAGTKVAKVTSAAGSAVATGWARIHTVTLVPQGCASNTTVTIYDNTSASGTKILDAVPILDANGVRVVDLFAGVECQNGIYAVVNNANCHVLVEYSQ